MAQRTCRPGDRRDLRGEPRARRDGRRAGRARRRRVGFGGGGLRRGHRGTRVRGAGRSAGGARRGRGRARTLACAGRDAAARRARRVRRSGHRAPVGAGSAGPRRAPPPPTSRPRRPGTSSAPSATTPAQACSASPTARWSPPRWSVRSARRWSAAWSATAGWSSCSVPRPRRAAVVARALRPTDRGDVVDVRDVVIDLRENPAARVTDATMRLPVTDGRSRTISI